MLTTNELQKRFKDIEVTGQEISALDVLFVGVKSWILALCNNNHKTAIFLCHLIHCAEQKIEEGKGEIEVYKTSKDWEEETGLKRYAQEEARRILRKAGIITERRKRTANCMCVVHYTLKVEVLQEYMELVAKQLKSEGKLNRHVIAQERKFQKTAKWKAKNAERMKSLPLKTKLQMMQEKLAAHHLRKIQKEAKKRAATQPQQLVQPAQRIEQPLPNSMTTEQQAIGLTNVRYLLGLLKGSR